MESFGNVSASAVCWESTSWEEYLLIPVTVLALAVCCLDLVFAVANLKFNKELSPLGKVMTTAFFVNSTVPWFGRLLHFALEKALSEYNAYLCLVLGIVFVCSMHFQTCLLSAVAHDRAQLVCHSLTYRELTFQKRPWFFLLICLSPPLAAVVSTMSSRESFCVNTVLGCIGNPNYFSLRSLIGITVAEVLQWSCTIWYVVSYIIIVREVRRIAQEPRMRSVTGRRALRTLAVLAAQHATFIIIPSTFGAMSFSSLDFSSRLWLYKLHGALYAGNDVIAPITYVCFDKSTRKAFKKCFCGKRRSS